MFKKKGKLQGTNLKSISPKKKKELEKQLEIMQKTRQDDEVWLRDELNKKLKLFKEEKEKKVKTIEQYTLNIKSLQVQNLRLEGAINILEFYSKKDKNTEAK